MSAAPKSAANEPFEYTLALPTYAPIIMEANSVLTIARKLVRTIEVTNPRSFALKSRLTRVTSIFVDIQYAGLGIEPITHIGLWCFRRVIPAGSEERKQLL